MKYRLVLTTQDAKVFEVNKLKHIEADSVVELAAKFPLMMAELMREECEAEIAAIKEKYIDDDIPF